MLALLLLPHMPQLLLLLLPLPHVTSHLLHLNLPHWSWLSKLVFKLAEAWQGSAGSRWCMVRMLAMDCHIISAIFIYLFAIRNASFQLKSFKSEQSCCIVFILPSSVPVGNWNINLTEFSIPPAPTQPTPPEKIVIQLVRVQFPVLSAMNFLKIVIV